SCALTIYKVCLLFTFSGFLMLISLDCAMAQKKKDVRDIIMSGNEYYYQDQYSKAIEFYYKAVSIDSLNSFANFHLAESYRKTFDFKEAEKYYKIVAKNNLKDYPLSGFYYPQMQKLNGKFKEAI